jgi:fatty-acyl-CoA synthase
MPYTVNIAWWIERNALIYAQRTAVIDDRRRLSYARLQDRVSRLAGALRASGVGRGDRVASLLYNSGEIVELTFACARLGALFVPLNWRLGMEELEFILKDCTPAALVYEKEWQGKADALRKTAAAGWWAAVSDDAGASDYEKALEGASPVATHEPGTGGDDDLFIIYTSGTTGLPKGVVLTHENVFWQTINGWSLGVTPETVCLVLLPLFHVGGLHSSVTPMLHVGAAVILQRKFDARRVLRTLVEEKVTGIVAVPAIYQFLADLPELGAYRRNPPAAGHDPSPLAASLHPTPPRCSSTTPASSCGAPALRVGRSLPTGRLPPLATEDFSDRLLEGADLRALKVLISGGAPLPHHLIEFYHSRGFEFRQGYGLTEASPGVTGMGPGEFLRKAGSAGRLLLYTEVRIAGDDGSELPPGEAGEIWVRGPNVMKGYWQRPAETAAALAEGWLHTGDIGKLDDEGFITIVDRKKDMIISGGENVYPAEIEKILAGHPDVELAAVVGKSDRTWGEVPVAVVIAKRENLRGEDLAAFLEGKLARYKIPREWVFVKELPLNAAGKVIKKEVKKTLGIS